MVTRHAIAGHYIDQDLMTAMYRVMVGTRDPMLAIPQVMACKICYEEADYQCEVVVAVAVKQDVITQDVTAQDAMMARSCQL